MTARLSTTLTASIHFIEAERSLYQDQNRFPASMGSTMRYLTFLSIVEERHAQVGEAVMVDIRRKFSGPSGMRKLTPEQGAELEVGMRRAEVLHLEIESFLVFAKMLLDKVAHFIEDYFGPARGISLKSHDKLCKSALAYALEKGIELPAGMMETMQELKVKVSDVRDKKIAHLREIRMGFGTIFTPEGTTSIAYPDSQGGTQTPPVSELAALIDTYMGQIQALVRTNRARTRLQRTAENPAAETD